jgi:hypothetical protein
MDDRPDIARHTHRVARRRRGVVAGALVSAILVIAFVTGIHYLTRPSSRPQASAVPGTTSTLPQTNQFPAANTPQFSAKIQALWNGVIQGSVQPALPAFFPRSAYVQLKTGIYDPAGDWTNRLVADYRLDIEAAHALIASDPSAAKLVSVSVPEQYGHWIDAGICANGIGYYEVANSRLEYQFQGQTRSFGIASMISWRGEWYVVHLGAILRSGAGGVVEDPEVGSGFSAPSSTC